jgi:2-amino-4-hydroxy-6-hydroxymethyldihydropteridine diphosphokinase
LSRWKAGARREDGTVHLGLGSNLGDRLRFLEQGLRFLLDHGVELVQTSSLYETEPVGYKEQGDFLNLVVAVRGPEDPRELLKLCLMAEEAMGRERRIPDGPRTLDLDILLFGSRIHRWPGLEIPHPRLHLRRFVLAPLEEIAPDRIHPVFQRSVRELLVCCPDPSEVRKTSLRLGLEPRDPSGYNPAASRGLQ